MEKYYSSIKFTETHHDEVAELFDYDYLYEEKNKKDLNRSLQNLRKLLEDNDAPRYLYVIRSGNTNKYKLGITNNLAKRIKTHQTSNPYSLKFIFGVEADLADFLGREIVYLEKFLHKNYEHLRIQGEWFKFNKQHLSDMCFYFEENRGLEVFHYDPEELSIYRMKVRRILIQDGILDRNGNYVDFYD